MYSEKRFLTVLIFALVIGCGKKGSTPDPTPDPPDTTDTKVSYTADVTDFANPERDFIDTVKQLLLIFNL